jgi:hypothetical protein
MHSARNRLILSYLVLMRDSCMCWVYLTFSFSRTSSQKPGDEFIANFRQTFPEVGVATSSAETDSGDTSLGEAIAGEPQPERYVYFPRQRCGSNGLGPLSDLGPARNIP